MIGHSLLPLCICSSAIDQFGDYFLGCSDSYGPLCIQCHDAPQYTTPLVFSVSKVLPLISLVLGTFTIPISLKAVQLTLTCQVHKSVFFYISSAAAGEEAEDVVMHQYHFLLADPILI